MSDAPDAEPVDTTDEAAEIYVADPDDYAKTRKLKALSDAKAHVRTVRNGFPETASQTEWQGLHSRLAEAVASYGHGLLPLLKEAEDAGIIETGDYKATIVGSEVDVREFINLDGRLHAQGSDDDATHPTVSMAVFRELQTLERKLGLGLQLTSDDTDEWEIDV